MSKVRQEQFALGHKKGTNCQKLKKIQFFELIACFLREIRSNREQITHIALANCSRLLFKMSNFEQKSE